MIAVGTTYRSQTHDRGRYDLETRNHDCGGTTQRRGIMIAVGTTETRNHDGGRYDLESRNHDRGRYELELRNHDRGRYNVLQIADS